MTEHLLVGLTTVIIVGVGAQWLAWRLRVPSILLLLIFGFLAGPVIGILRPDELLGDLLLPVVSLSVALILFEGGLSLRISELREIGGVVRNLLSVGVIVTWISGTAAAHFILKLDFQISILLGAVIVVTGPTVIIPLLRHVRPVRQVGSILKWEGIVIDPIGAMLSVLVFEAILQSGFEQATRMAVAGTLKTVIVGGVIGTLAAFAMVLFLRKFWIPDYLQNPVSLTMVVGAFTAANSFQPESGLLAVTIMGVILANQKSVAVKHIIEFKENLRVLLLSGLFIVLAARLQVSDLNRVNLASLAFLGVLFFFARPASVAVATIGSELTWRERLFLAWMAPRGIVAAAVSSVFALRLTELDHPEAEFLVPLTFMVIVSTVAVYGLTASCVARWLGVSRANPQGVLFVGAHTWAQEIAQALHKEGYEVLLVDTNRQNISRARMAGLPAVHANVLSQHFSEEVELGDIRRSVALTSNDEVNSLVSMQFAEAFSRAEVYQLLAEGEEEGHKRAAVHHLHGRHLFGPGMTYGALETAFARGAKIKKNRLTEEFDYAAFRARYGEKAVPLFMLDKDGEISVFTTESKPLPKPGQTLISLVSDDTEKG
ncbi:MAG: hypothetical protein C4532_10600 [Candidatus Abyssobacteria bacterium SURF_17]|uniref:Uncharacterized protein n=1 Tax=Candidatus Abyssobacteria bacterium SURF_17 TaxID=2093361 RepID=A0A419EXF2_9BACT|nr:MAG: hypothetical protein C4532_10600 [Candidatus Abyssubacteria bacterium SURF_17]